MNVMKHLHPGRGRKLAMQTNLPPGSFGFTEKEMKFAWGKYMRQTRQCQYREPDMKMTFDEWITMWVESGHWEERGRSRGNYCMSRYGDKGDYEVGNCYINLHSENSKEAMNNALTPARRLILEHDPVYIKKQSDRMKESLAKIKEDPVKWAEYRYRQSTRCTIDGVKIYDSVAALIAELGRGKNGKGSPNFRHIKD